MKWLGGVMLVLLSLTGNAQKTVFQNLTWEQAAELAQKENKIILVDAMREPATPGGSETKRQGRGGMAEGCCQPGIL